MSDRKPYIPPQVFRVELNHEQAILSACSLTAANAMAGGANAACRVAQCKMGAVGGDAGPRAS
jgi:hypothetical protein